jgi:hypothetical protein
LGKELVAVANKNPAFRRAIEEECLKQERSDYNVAIDKVLQISLQKQLVSQDYASRIDELVKRMVTLKPGRLPIVFVPVVENFDTDADIYKGTSLTSKYDNTGNTDVNITVVSRDAEVSKGDLYPGYRFNSSGKWETSGLISEDFAWKNDVWVIGYEENVSTENRVTYKKHSDRPKTVRNPQSRVNGKAEYGALIQVIDLGAIESWANGKPEFKYFVHNAFGTLIKERPFDGWARSNYSNQQWFDYEDFIGTWNTSNWGSINYERWIEQDGGKPTTVTMSIPNPAGGPTISISTTFAQDDENLGLGNVQFTDYYQNEPGVTPTTYTLQNMNFRRK